MSDAKEFAAIVENMLLVHLGPIRQELADLRDDLRAHMSGEAETFRDFERRLQSFEDRLPTMPPMGNGAG